MFPIALLAALAAGALAADGDNTINIGVVGFSTSDGDSDDLVARATGALTEDGDNTINIGPVSFPTSDSDSEDLVVRATGALTEDGDTTINIGPVSFPTPDGDSEDLVGRATGALAEKATDTFTVRVGTDPIPTMHTHSGHLAALTTGATGTLGQHTLTFASSNPTSTLADNSSAHRIAIPTFDDRPKNHIFVDAVGLMDNGFVGAVRKPKGCSTTVELSCDESSEPNVMCELNSKFRATMTVGPSEFKLRYSTKIHGTKHTLAESCSLDDSGVPYGLGTQALCLYSAKSVINEWNIEPMTGKAMIPITAGAKNLPKRNAICTLTTSTDSGALPTGILEIKKVVVPLVLAAGAQALL